MSEQKESYLRWLEKNPHADTYIIGTVEFESLLSELELAQQEIEKLKEEKSFFVKAYTEKIMES